MPLSPTDPDTAAFAIELPCAPPDKPVSERLHEPLPDQVDFRVLADRPCILFQGWDYAEDWSGAFVSVIRPERLAEARSVSAEEFWRLVREIQQLRREMSG